MIKLNHLPVICNYNKYTVSNFIDFKKSLNCFNLFEHRLVESIVLKYGDFFLLDFGISFVMKTKEVYSLNKYININNISLDSLCNVIHFDYFILKRTLICCDNWSLLKKAFQYNCFIAGRFLNLYEKGLSIGVFGFIGYALKKDIFYNENKLISIFTIAKINLFTKEFLLSQKSIKRLVYRALFKLSSLIIYVSNN